MRWLQIVLAILVLGSAPALAQPTSPPPPATVAQIPLSAFGKLPFFDGPELSPDGTRVAAKISVDGQQVLAIFDLFKKEKPVVIGLGQNDLLSWDWVNDAWLVARVGATTIAEGDSFFTTRIVGIPANGGKLTLISFRTGGQSASVLWRASDGTPRIRMMMQKSIYLGEDFWPEVEEVDLSNGRMRTVVDGRTNVMNWAADATGAVRMGIGYNDNSRTSTLLYRPEGSGSFRVVDRANRRRDESLSVPILLAGNTTKAFTIRQSDGRDALYEFDLATLEPGKRVFAAPGYDIDSVILNPAGTDVAGVRYTAASGRVQWFDPAMAEIQAMLDKAVGTRAARIVSLSRDQKKMIIWVGDASQPGAYYYFDAIADGSMRRFAYVNEMLGQQPLGPVSTFQYKARDGLSIEAVLTLPKGRDPKNLPLILMPHGGPEARDVAGYDWWVQFLASRGYAVVQPNYRGSTGYGEAFLKAGEGEWGRKMQDDLNDAVTDLAAKGTIDPKRVCIVGASYGGYAAMRGAQRDGEKFRCAISYAGVSDLNGMISYDSRFLYGNTSRDGWKESAPDLKEVSPVNHAADFSTPILIVHGKKDLRVPLSQSRRMADRLREAGKPVDYVEQPKGDHYFSREADRLQFLEVMEAFLKKHNPA
jgi:dipeptidyl aminopeptidase/acylaminoacyl peptidase